MISDSDLENGHNIVCCSNCTLSIRVLYNVLSDDASNDQSQSREKIYRDNFLVGKKNRCQQLTFL